MNASHQKKPGTVPSCHLDPNSYGGGLRAKLNRPWPQDEATQEMEDVLDARELYEANTEHLKALRY